MRNTRMLTINHPLETSGTM